MTLLKLHMRVIKREREREWERDQLQFVFIGDDWSSGVEEVIAVVGRVVNIEWHDCFYWCFSITCLTLSVLVFKIRGGWIDLCEATGPIQTPHFFLFAFSIDEEYSPISPPTNTQKSALVHSNVHSHAKKLWSALQSNKIFTTIVKTFLTKWSTFLDTVTRRRSSVV